MTWFNAYGNCSQVNMILMVPNISEQLLKLKLVSSQKGQMHSTHHMLCRQTGTQDFSQQTSSRQTGTAEKVSRLALSKLACCCLKHMSYVLLTWSIRRVCWTNWTSFGLWWLPQLSMHRVSTLILLTSTILCKIWDWTFPWQLFRRCEAHIWCSAYWYIYHHHFITLDAVICHWKLIWLK